MAAATETTLVTVFFKTSEATVGSRWEVHAYATEDDPTDPAIDSYMARVGVGNSDVKVYRVVAGGLTLLGTFPYVISDAGPVAADGSLPGTYHRLDLMVARQPTYTKLRVYVDHDPSPWYLDPTVAGRPDGVETLVATIIVRFPTGRLRTAAILAREQD